MPSGTLEGMRVAAGVMIVLAVTMCLASADPAAREVNLLVSTPTVVGVSSSVTSRALRPENLVDGRLDTAWSSKTNDLVGAWITVAVPADVHISAIKLTAGMTRKDPSRGDLFTMNPRITKIRVLHNDVPLFERELDLDDRGLQTVAMDVAGGDLKIEVVDVHLGTWPGWREVSVSELELWGTLARGIAVESRPHVVVGAPHLPSSSGVTQCESPLAPGAIALPSNRRSRGFQVYDPEGEIIVCRFDNVAEGSSDTRRVSWVSLLAYPPARNRVRVERLMFRTEWELYAAADGRESTLTDLAFPLTMDEIGLLVQRTEHTWRSGQDEGTKISTLYRVTGTGFVALLEYKSTWGARDGKLCTLRPPPLGTTMPRLEVACVRARGLRRAPLAPGDAWIPRPDLVEHYQWNGAGYVRN
jgi:hypothetical protein